MIPHLPRLAGVRLRALSFAVAIVLVGCSPAPPFPTQSPSPSGSSAPAASPTPLSSEDLAAIYSEINGQVQAIRGLEETGPIVPVVVTRPEFAVLLREQLDPPEVLAAYERLYKGMGLLPAGASLADVYAELLETQASGMYDPTKKTLYVLSKGGGIGPLERSIYAHEYQHALQDQHFDLQSHRAEIRLNGDFGLAWQSVVEGDAYTLGTLWMLQGLTPFELMDLIGQSEDPEAMAALDRLPPIVIAQILFAAVQGTTWISGVQARGGWEAVDQVLRDPPMSTEQILHPEKWESREAPLAVDLPDDLPGRLGVGWTKALEDTFGEQQISVWLTGKVDVAAILSPPPPPDAVAGWGGDRLAVLDGPGDQWAVVIKTEWDTAVDAAEFESAIVPLLAKAGGPGQVLPGEGGTIRWIVIGSDDATLASVAAALGLAG